jgi:hypothetical protein
MAANPLKPVFTYAPKTDLLQGMKNRNRTSDWDVVVSYRLDPLNQLLRQLWTESVTMDESTNVTKKKFENVNVSFDMALSKKVHMQVVSPNVCFLMIVLLSERWLEREPCSSTRHFAYFMLFMDMEMLA